MRPKLLVCGKLGLTHRPLPSRVDLLKVANPVLIYSGDRSTIPNFLKFFRTWTLAHGAENAIVANELVRVDGKDRNKLDNAHGRQKVNQYIAPWAALLVKGIERSKIRLDMVTTAESPSEAWNILLSMVGDESI